MKSRRLAEAGFRQLYADHSDDLLAYALRRVRNAEDAADVVAETFLVAWRRFGEMPSGDDARPGLFGVARRVAANQHRGERRRSNLAVRLQMEIAATVDDRPPSEDPDNEVRVALLRLSPADRELLMLVSWEGLTPSQAAKVLEISPVAARSRLLRARRRLRREMAGEHRSPGAAITTEEER